MHRLKDKLHTLTHQHDNNDQHQLPIHDPPQQTTPSKTINTNDRNEHESPSTSVSTTPTLLQTTQLAITVFLASLDPTTGEVKGLGHWQTANGFTAIALHDLYSQTPDSGHARAVRAAVGETLKRCPGCINEFNDDTLWWGICMLELRELRHCSSSSSSSSSNDSEGHHKNEAYTTPAFKIQTHVSASVIPPNTHTVGGNDMHGAVLWTSKPGEQQVNAITTALYAELCARLALLTSDPALATRLLHAAETSLGWIFRCRYDGPEAVVLDTIFLRTGDCRDWRFTYTTGQAISASVALFVALSSQPPPLRREERGLRPAGDYLALACAMAAKSLDRASWVDDDGVLTERDAYGPLNHQAWENDDAVGFKSVLVRALAKLYKVLKEEDREEGLREAIARFVECQFRSLRERNCFENRGQYGPWWGGPLGLATSHAQLAVLDVMAAVHLVRGEE